jgi:hypothetical protein
MKAVNINILDKFLDERDVTNVCGENLIFFNERKEFQNLVFFMR